VGSATSGGDITRAWTERPVCEEEEEEEEDCWWCHCAVCHIEK